MERPTNTLPKSLAHLSPEDRALSELLASGGDERSVPGPDGLNRYGGAAFPRASVPFGSCTCSGVSPRGWRAARAAFAEWQARAAEAGEIRAADHLAQGIRTRLVELMELAEIDGLQVLITPSGSDAEMLALFIASLGHGEPLANIVVGAREVGSGTVLAAGCRHFSHLVPSGQGREPGTAVDEALAARTSVHQVRVRVDNSGERAPHELDEEIGRLVDGNLAAGARVILHVVAHSKTGVHAPRLETVNELVRRHGPRLVPVIDAAQGRFSRRGLKEYLARGFMVILTGSKFYGGPSFSGCLLVPPRWLPGEVAGIRLPPGFSDYLTPAQLPAAWSGARQDLEQRANPGLLLRWRAAIAEMAAYYEAPGEARLAILRFFESAVPRILGGSPLLELMNLPTPVMDDAFERLLESKTTVFSFRVKVRHGASMQLDQATLAEWLAWMNHDISAWASLPDTPELREAARTRFQLGQAVHVGEQGSGEQDYVIRVAIGAVLITDVATDLTLGAALEQRLAWLVRQLQLLRLKFEFIAAHEDSLARGA